MLPRVLCMYWGFHSWWCLRQRGVLHDLLNLAISPERMPLTHGCRRPPPDMPSPGIDPTTLRLRDLRFARLSEPGIFFLPGLPGWTRMATLASSGRVAPHYSRPLVQAFGAGQGCIPVLPLDQCVCVCLCVCV